MTTTENNENLRDFNLTDREKIRRVFLADGAKTGGEISPRDTARKNQQDYREFFARAKSAKIENFDEKSAKKPREKSAENSEKFREISEVPPTIKLSKISKNYGFGDTETDALAEVDLEIQRGEFVAIMGPSGCGKTTLLNILGLLDKPSSGEYFLNAKKVAKISAGKKARIRGAEIGFIFQNFNLIPTLTVLDNVALPLTYARGIHFKNLEKASKMLKTFGLQNREYYLPNQLSGGQTQRVAIARALINRPSIILADEPTGNLDSKNSENIMRELTSLHRDGNTILMVTHNPELLKFASRVIHMKDGKIDRDIELTDTNAYKTTARFISKRKKMRSRRFRFARMRNLQNKNQKGGK